MSAIDFRFIEFNPVRAFRGAPAARVAVVTTSGENWLWMNQRHIAENIKLYGETPELAKAKAAYGGIHG
jgi:hypothetical protein